MFLHSYARALEVLHASGRRGAMDPFKFCYKAKNGELLCLAEKIKNPIYPLWSRGRKRSLNWFKVDTRSWEISPVLEGMPDDVPANPAAVTLGPVIYVIGGRYGCQYDDHIPRVHDAYYYNTLHPEHGWRKAPALLAPKSFPIVFTFDGKIYAFGGACCDSDFEVYDPAKNSWEALPEPPDNFGIDDHWSTFHAIDGRNKRVLFQMGESECLYAYHFDDKSWVLANPSFGYRAYGSVVMDGVIYFVSYNDRQTGLVVRAYDLQYNKQLRGEFALMPVNDPDYFDPTGIVLSSLGNGKFCVSWDFRQKTSNGLTCVVQLITLRVERIEVGVVPCYINVIQESAATFDLEGYISVVDMVAL